MSDTARERHRLSAHRDYSLRRIGKTHEQHHSHLTETQVQKCANLRLTVELEHSITYKAVLTFQVASNEQAIRVRSRFSEREGDFGFVEKVFDIGHRDSGVFGIGNAQGAAEADADAGTVEEREGAKPEPKVDLLKRIAEEGSAVKRPAQLKTWLERERKALLANDEMFPQSNGGKLRFESHKRRP